MRCVNTASNFGTVQFIIYNRIIYYIIILPFNFTKILGINIKRSLKCNRIIYNSKKVDLICPIKILLILDIYFYNILRISTCSCRHIKCTKLQRRKATAYIMSIKLPLAILLTLNFRATFSSFKFNVFRMYFRGACNVANVHHLNLHCLYNFIVFCNFVLLTVYQL